MFVKGKILNKTSKSKSLFTNTRNLHIVVAKNSSNKA
jgi:hypothetical protein